MTDRAFLKNMTLSGASEKSEPQLAIDSSCDRMLTPSKYFSLNSLPGSCGKIIINPYLEVNRFDERRVCSFKQAHPRHQEPIIYPICRRETARGTLCQNELSFQALNNMTQEKDEGRYISVTESAYRLRNR